MITLSLNYDQRIQLELLLGQQRGNVGQIATFLRIIGAIHLSDEEQRACRLRAENGRFLWDTKPEWPVLEAKLEHADAVKLREVLTSFDQFIPSDFTWVEPILAGLTAA